MDKKELDPLENLGTQASMLRYSPDNMRPSVRSPAQDMEGFWERCPVCELSLYQVLSGASAVLQTWRGLEKCALSATIWRGAGSA